MLGGGDKHTLAHKAGGVADLGNIASGGGDFEVVEVGSAKENAAAAGRGEQAHMNGRSAVQADAGEFDRGGYRLFKITAFYQNGRPRPKSRYSYRARRHRLTGEKRSFIVVNLPHFWGNSAQLRGSIGGTVGENGNAK
jgi:hypothetical protein